MIHCSFLHGPLDLFAFALKLESQFFLAWEKLQILRGEDLAAFAQDRIFRDRLAFVGAQDQAEDRVVAGCLEAILEEPYVAVHLPYVTMGQSAVLQIDEEKALEDVVVEHEVDVEILVVESDVALARDEGESLAQLEEERLQVVDDGLFDVAFVEFGFVGQAEEFEYVRRFQHVGSVEGFAGGGVRDSWSRSPPRRDVRRCAGSRRCESGVRAGPCSSRIRRLRARRSRARRGRPRASGLGSGTRKGGGRSRCRI